MQLGIPLLLLLILIIVSDKYRAPREQTSEPDPGHFARIVEDAKHKPPARLAAVDE